MANWTVGKKLFTGIGALVALLLLSGTAAIWSASTLKEELDTAIQKTSKKLALAHTIQETVVRLRSEQRRALVAAFGDDHATVDQAAKRVDDLGKENERNLEDIGALIVTEEGRRTLAEIRKLQADWIAVDDDVHALIAKHQDMPAWELARTKANPLIDEIDKRGNVLLEQQNAFLKESEAVAESDYNLARLVLLSVLIVSLLVAVAIGYSVRSITGTLRQTANQLA